MHKPGRIYSISYRCNRARQLTAVAMGGVSFSGALIQVTNCKACGEGHKFYVDGSEYVGDDPEMTVTEGADETSPDRSSDQGVSET